MDAGKQKIIQLFEKNVKGKKPDLSNYTAKHDGKEGHWLEGLMGVKPNADNKPDLYGYEMKKYTPMKTTFGDWSANSYIFKDKSYGITRDDFLKIFGKPNVKKNGRFSWSGEPCPTIKKYNSFGQKLFVDKDKNIIAKYSYSKDKRLNKQKVVPKIMQKEDLILAFWNADSMKKKVEDKFNVKGWFKCQKNAEGVYDEIVFGDPITFDRWIKDVESGDIFFDSGMYQGNFRPYSQWRAVNNYWNKLIVSRY